jgi:hypothetical protein
MNPTFQAAAILAIWSLVLTGTCRGEEVPKPEGLSTNQLLIVSCFELDIERVKSLLRDGANVNARMGDHPQDQFQDKWTGGWPIASNKWTPLLALAHSHREPQPTEQAKNTVEALEAAQKTCAAIDPKLIIERNNKRSAIARILVDAKANYNLDDGYGDTALSQSVYVGYDELALLLIEVGANVNTKTGVYIDGTGDITPLHRATDRPHLVKALLRRGANPNARDDSGETPLHWAARDAEPECVRLLIEAGAEVDAKDKKGRSPLSWVRTADQPPLPQDPRLAELFGKLFPDGANQKTVADLLRKAGAK